MRLIAAAARLFGYDPARAEHYPLRWWIVLGIALVAGPGGGRAGGHLRRNVVLAVRPGGLGVVQPFRLPVGASNGGATRSTRSSPTRWR